MTEEQPLRDTIAQAMGEPISSLQLLGSAYGSNRVYQLTTATGQRYVVKQPKQVRESFSPFWQQMDLLFGINKTSQISALPHVAARLQQQTILPVPKVIHTEPNPGSDQEPFAVVTAVAGEAYEPDTFPPSAALHYQLGQYIGYLHAQTDTGYGNVLAEPRPPRAAFLPALIAGMRHTITTFWNDQPALHGYLTELAATTPLDAIFSTANLIMIDISANQFVYANNQITGVVDLDAYVIGPREFELAILEMCISQPAAFRQGYAEYATLPTFASFRPLYRLWSYLNEPDQGYDRQLLETFMQRAVYFD
ncbi:MAG: aminoglycoside phosphotransferase family protein [Caldilineaceae bacterium]|nr:aminoglycoside phosphotransferase family protein [Caldilineaceae bacterium]